MMQFKETMLRIGHFVINRLCGNRPESTDQLHDLYEQAQALTERENEEARPEERRWMTLERVTYTRNGSTEQTISIKIPDEVLMLPVLTGGDEPKVVLVEREAPAFGEGATIMSVLSKADISRTRDTRVVAFQALQKLSIQGAEAVMPKRVLQLSPWKYSSATSLAYMCKYDMTEQEFMATTTVNDTKTRSFKAYTETELLGAIANNQVRDLRAIALALKTFGQLRGEYLPHSTFELPDVLKKLLLPLHATAVDLHETVSCPWFNFIPSATGEPLLVKTSDQAQALCVIYDETTGAPIRLAFNAEPVVGHKVVTLGNASGGVNAKKGFTPETTAIAEAHEEIGVTAVEPEVLVAGLPLGMYWDFVSYAVLTKVARLDATYGDDGDESLAEQGTRVTVPMSLVRKFLANDVFADATTQAALYIFLAKRRAQ